MPIAYKRYNFILTNISILPNIFITRLYQIYMIYTKYITRIYTKRIIKYTRTQKFNKCNIFTPVDTELYLPYTLGPDTQKLCNYSIITHSHLTFSLIVSPVRSTYGGYYGLVVVTPPRPRPPRPRPHFIVYAITLKNLIGLLPYLICRLI